MDRDTKIETHLRSLPLNSDLLVLDLDTETFFKAETGIHDTEELRKHVVQVQEDAYKVGRHHPSPHNLSNVRMGLFRTQVYPYPCIRAFRFARLKIAKMPIYPRVLQLLEDRPDALFLDIGCCSK